jgi:hypothetical protein
MATAALVSVIETVTFAARAKDRMSKEEVTAAITMIATDPLCGVVMKDTGGLRKVRFAIAGRGKSGGVRIVYAFHNPRFPVYLLTVFAKNEKDNLSKAERNTLRKVVEALFR